MAAKVYKLNDAKLAALKDQILIVLADYKSMSPQMFHTESTRIYIANRVIANLKHVAQRRGVR